MGEVTHTDKGNGVQMSFYTSLYHTYRPSMLLLMTMGFQEQASALTPIPTAVNARIRVNARETQLVTRLRTTNDDGMSVRGLSGGIN